MIFAARGRIVNASPHQGQAIGNANFLMLCIRSASE
jgi:hypothetical protein